MTNQLSRRRVLSIGGAGTALTLAGCSSSDDPGPDRPNKTEPEQTNTTDRQPGDDAEGLATVTLSVEIPEAELESAREEFNQRQQELEDELEDGEISQQEFQARAQRARDEIQRRYIADVTTRLETTIGDSERFTLSESAPNSGLLLIDGPPDGLIELLTNETVRALFAEGAFEATDQQG